jgi:azurin
MAHNVVVLVKGTDIVDFADVARYAKNEQYVPSSVESLVIAHTKMVNGGQSDEVDFMITEPGTYDYICSYPGHWGTMQGKIVAE